MTKHVDITEDKVKIVQDADAIYREEIESAGLGRDIAQYFAALLNKVLKMLILSTF